MKLKTGERVGFLADGALVPGIVTATQTRSNGIDRAMVAYLSHKGVEYCTRQAIGDYFVREPVDATDAMKRRFAPYWERIEQLLQEASHG